MGKNGVRQPRTAPPRGRRLLRLAAPLLVVAATLGLGIYLASLAAKPDPDAEVVMMATRLTGVRLTSVRTRVIRLGDDPIVVYFAGDATSRYITDYCLEVARPARPNRSGTFPVSASNGSLRGEYRLGTPGSPVAESEEFAFRLFDQRCDHRPTDAGSIASIAEGVIRVGFASIESTDERSAAVASAASFMTAALGAFPAVFELTRFWRSRRQDFAPNGNEGDEQNDDGNQGDEHNHE
jgi:hypothetical protein